MRSPATGLTALLLAPDVFWPLRPRRRRVHAAHLKAGVDKAFALLDRDGRARGWRVRDRRRPGRQ